MNFRMQTLLSGNETKLKIYALFKQSTAGTVTTKRPGMMDFVGRAKWDAWNSLGSMSQEEAQKTYIQLVDSLVGEEVSCVIFHKCSTLMLCHFILLCTLSLFIPLIWFYSTVFELSYYASVDSLYIHGNAC